MAITAHENMNLIAVGYKDGTVQLMKGNITRDRASRQVVIHKETEAGVYVTGKLHVPGWKDMRNFVIRPYLRVRVAINAMHLIFMCILRAHVN